MALLDRLRGGSGGDGPDSGCDCSVQFREPAGTGLSDRTVLELDADGCAGGGDLAAAPGCRATAVRALAGRDADAVRTVAGGRQRAYVDRAVALLLAAGRFRERVAFRDDRLAALAARDPLAAAREATGRADPVARIAAETGLAATAEAVETVGPAEAVDGAGAAGTTGAAGSEGDGPSTGTAADYGAALPAHVGSTVAAARIAARPPADARLRDRWTTDTGATVRLYATDAPLDCYHLTPPEAALDADALATLAAARERLADAAGGDRGPVRAVRAVAGPDDPAEAITAALAKHTRGHGIFEDVFADGRVTDAFLSAPVTDNPLRVVVDGERLRTNVRLPPEGAARLASRLRRASGRGFSRASPTLDATIGAGGARVRVAATAPPASDGLAFTFRRADDEAWTLPRLVDAGTLTPAAAGLLSTAVRRGAAGLIAGGRGAGKTTTLAGLLWELDPETRLLLVEDTPELPAAGLRDAGRDVQRLAVGDGPALTATEAVRTALRMGDGALVVGEVRGEEAAALYEAMRVGAQRGAVLGTIHGSDGPSVRERVVTDLGVPESAFAATELLVTLADRQVVRISEVRRTDGGVAFYPLFERGSDGLAATGVLDRGESRLLDGLAGPAEAYADVLGAVDERRKEIARLVEAGATGSAAVAAAVADR